MSPQAKIICWQINSIISSGSIFLEIASHCSYCKRQRVSKGWWVFDETNLSCYSKYTSYDTTAFIFVKHSMLVVKNDENPHIIFICLFPLFKHLWAWEPLSHWLWRHTRFPDNHQWQAGIISMDGLFILLSRKWRTNWLLWWQFNIWPSDINCRPLCSGENHKWCCCYSGW